MLSDPPKLQLLPTLNSPSWRTIFPKAIETVGSVKTMAEPKPEELLLNVFKYNPVTP